MHPRAILVVRARRSSCGSVRVRAAERALLPRERGHPARGRAPGAPGNLSLRAPARDTRQDAVGPCWRRRAAAAAPGRGARRRSEGRRQQVVVVFTFFFSCWGEGCVDRHSEEREREGDENTIGNPFLICMNERGHHAHELCPPKTSHGGHEAPQQNLIEFHFFAFFPSTQCVADEQQVGEKYRPVARARASARAICTGSRPRRQTGARTARFSSARRPPRRRFSRPPRKTASVEAAPANRTTKTLGTEPRSSTLLAGEENVCACSNSAGGSSVATPRSRRVRFRGRRGAHFLRGKNHMPYFDVRVLNIDEPLASCMAGFPKKGRPAVRHAGARGQRLSLVVVVVVLGRW